jgi:hypothetical protein
MTKLADTDRLRVMIYKRTHTGDPTPDGIFGLSDCMGRVRAREFDAVIGVGGLSAEPRSHGIDGRVTWVGGGCTSRRQYPRGTSWTDYRIRSLPALRAKRTKTRFNGPGARASSVRYPPSRSHVRRTQRVHAERNRQYPSPRVADRP